MVNYSPKWNLPAEEVGDPSDMPAATGRLRASIEAALDKCLGQALAGVAGKVAKTGDTMSGPLTVTDLTTTGRVKSGYDLMTGNWSWLAEQGELRLIRWSPNLAAVESMPIVLNYASGAVTIAHTVTMPGVPTSAGGGEIASSTEALVRLAGGALRGFNRTSFALWLNLSPSSRRFKQNIRAAAPSGVLDVETVTFQYRPEVCDDPATHLGVVAEQVAEVFPAAVVRDAGGQPEGVDVVALVAGLIHEVRGLRDRVAVLEGGE